MIHVSTANQDPHSPGVSTFEQFAITAEQIAAAQGLTKVAILGDYFASLSDNDLRLAARYFAGSPFPQFDQRVLQVGGAALMNALRTVSEAAPARLQAELVKQGDLGNVAVDVLPELGPSLLLSQVGERIAALVEMIDHKQEVEAIADLLKQTSPLEAKYLLKLMTGDLRIGLQEAVVEDAIAQLAQQPVTRIQWANMLLGDIGETAVLARHNQLDTAKMRLFHPIKFMLASPVDDFAEIAQRMPEGFAVEDKYSGIRAQAHLAPVSSDKHELLHGAGFAGIRVALFSRTLDEITLTFPDLVQPLASMKSSAFGMGKQAGIILDGEIVPFRDDRILPFQYLQKRLGQKTLTEELLQAVPVAFIAYDILYRDGQVLLEEPYEVRQAILTELQLNSAEVRQAVSRRFSDGADLEQELQSARDRGNKGLMIKQLQSTYQPGKRVKDWLKVDWAID